MKLSNIESRKLLPRFASKIAWLMDALDSIIKPISERVKSIDAPLTLEAIAALTDEELEVLYDQYGVAQYYPELSRSTRDLMLYEMCKIYRYLGTPHAIELLCNYIFDNVPLNVHVLDNLAFDEHGTLIDASLLDVFDIEVNPDLPVLSVDATVRLLANIIRFGRNSQAFRDVIYTFSEDFSLPIYPLRAGIPAQNWDNDAICTLPPMTFIVVDSTTGAIVHGFNHELTTYELPSVVLNSEDGYETYELPSISLAVPKMVIGVPISGPVQAFWFTEDGQAETVDTELVIMNGLRDADGVKVKSVDNTDYQGANVLAYMEADGDMFTSSEASFTWFGSDSLRQLFVSNQDERGKSAWSVFAAKLFHLSFVNTQLPDVTIELPAAVVDTYGTSITLPTIDGEYESGGKTWKPSAWDIGAFGSSYTLNADTVAHLIFEEVQQYQEITLYMVNENKHTQNNVTSGFTGNVDSSYCYRLYTDAECTIPWTNYDYSNEYVVGKYNAGVWEPDAVQSVADMPDSAVSSGFKNAFILMDTGAVWFASSSSVDYGYYLTKSSITLRIYPKAQQWIPAFPYNSSSGEYDNLSTNRKGTFVRMGSPATVFGTFPAIAESFGYKSGMIKSASIQAKFQVSQAVLYLNVVGNPSLSNIVVRFENDIYTGYVRSDKADLPTAPSYDGATYTLKDDNGNNIDYDDSFTYKFVLLLNSAGEAVGSTNATGSMIKSSTGKLQVRIRYSPSKFNRVWYYRIPIS